METKTDIALKTLDMLEENLAAVRQFVHEGVLDKLYDAGVMASVSHQAIVVYVYVRTRTEYDSAEKILRAHGARGRQLRNVSTCCFGGVYPVWEYPALPWLEIHWQGMGIEEAKAMGILKDTCRIETVADTRTSLVCDI